MAINVTGKLFIKKSANSTVSGLEDPAMLKNTRYVGALSKKAEWYYCN
tara:strand:- start:405 stop:548 length:144 start_codon:yes stop_codon:yes gene_type:complete